MLSNLIQSQKLGEAVVWEVPPHLQSQHLEPAFAPSVPSQLQIPIHWNVVAQLQHVYQRKGAVTSKQAGCCRASQELENSVLFFASARPPLCAEKQRHSTRSTKTAWATLLAYCKPLSKNCPPSGLPHIFALKSDPAHCSWCSQWSMWYNLHSVKWW